MESVAADACRVAPDATIIIKSTVPVGFTRRLREELENENIFFSPEFLREGKALYDNLYPSRIIVGQDSDQGHRFSELLVTVLKQLIYRYSSPAVPRPGDQTFCKHLLGNARGLF